jgi:SAM-dependent methyltransferase
VTDLTAVKARQQATWSSGDYASVGNRILLVSELLCEAVDLRAGERVLDVATGTGNAALAASRRFAEVTGIDYAPALLEGARARASAEGLDVTFEEGDAEELPYDDGSFDVVLSACGAMFAPDHHKTADELVRVCRPGGRIGMVNWCPDGYIGQLLRAVGKHVPPPPGVQSPTLWGEPGHLRTLWGDRVELRAPRRTFLFRFPSPEHHVTFMAEHYGPLLKAVESLDVAGRDRLFADVLEVVARFNVAKDATLVLQQDYLEVVATRRGPA